MEDWRVWNSTNSQSHKYSRLTSGELLSNDRRVVRLPAVLSSWALGMLALAGWLKMRFEGEGWLIGVKLLNRNRPSHLATIFSKMVRWILFFEASKASLLSHLTPSWLYLFIPFLRTKLKCVSREIALKDHRSNIIAAILLSGNRWPDNRSKGQQFENKILRAAI